MIPEVRATKYRPDPEPPRSGWQQTLQSGYSSPDALLVALGLVAAQIPGGVLVQREFPTRVPASFVRRMRPGDPCDPLLLQVLPRGPEAAIAPGYSADPVGDLAANKSGGLLHKYAGRALLVTTGACAVHCRYCFRQHFPYREAGLRPQQWDRTLDYLRADTGLSEIILSGGDPLMLSDTRLQSLAEQLSAIPHLRRFRIHTRLPVVLPERIDSNLLAWLGVLPLAKVVVLHINHPQEIDPELASAAARLKAAGATLLNQSVLLRGINNEKEVLVELSEKLFAAGILPYYLHLLDPVQGAAHFDVSPAEAALLLDGLRTALPGYLVPRLVKEQAGARYKLPLELVSA